MRPLTFVAKPAGTNAGSGHLSDSENDGLRLDHLRQDAVAVDGIEPPVLVADAQALHASHGAYPSILDHERLHSARGMYLDSLGRTLLDLRRQGEHAVLQTGLETLETYQADRVGPQTHRRPRRIQSHAASADDRDGAVDRADIRRSGPGRPAVPRGRLGRA